MKKSSYTMDILGNIFIEGWSDGTSWNGWSRPVFEYGDAQKLLAALIKVYNEMSEPIRAWYDEREDSFCFVLPDEQVPECYQAKIIEVNGRKMRVYPIGTGIWVWEETRIAFPDLGMVQKAGKLD